MIFWKNNKKKKSVLFYCQFVKKREGFLSFVGGF